MKDLSLPKLHFKVFFCFVLISVLLILAQGCGGKKSEQAEAENDADKLDEDFDAVEKDDETEDEEDLDSDDTDNSETSTEEEPARQPTREECFKAGGTWDEEESRHCYRDKDCDKKPENTLWEGWYDYRQYYENGKWSEPYKTEYNDDKEIDACDFICWKNYSWDGTECKNLCDPDPCAEVEHSDGLCITTPGIYSCGCTDGYRWNDGKCVEITSKLSLGNICTCQSECYKDILETNAMCTAEGKELFGQDAVYASAGRCILQKYTIKETGIENEDIILDNNLKLEWQRTLSGEKYDWGTAVNYCENLEYGGYTDWRTPTPKELLSILGGRCDRETPDFYFKDSGLFLTSKLYAGNSNQVWLGENSFGNMSYFSRNLAIISVRCVRGKTIPEDTFTVSVVNGDEIVTDAATGLVWQKEDVSGKRWREALEYCENLTYAGYSDWRLPNINELASLANYDKYSPASDFPGISQENYWSSTTDIPMIVSALNIFFHTAELNYASKDTFYYVKCVR